jgi:hypothetical protein
MENYFIQFFVKVSQNKLVFKYNLVSLIFQTIPYLRDSWKSFKPTATDDSIEELRSQYPTLDTYELKFLLYIMNGSIFTGNMSRIMNAHRKLNFNNLQTDCAYTTEELKYFANQNYSDKDAAKIIDEVNSLIDDFMLEENGVKAEANRIYGADNIELTDASEMAYLEIVLENLECEYRVRPIKYLDENGEPTGRVQFFLPTEDDWQSLMNSIQDKIKQLKSNSDDEGFRTLCDEKLSMYKEIVDGFSEWDEPEYTPEEMAHLEQSYNQQLLGQ